MRLLFSQNLANSDGISETPVGKGFESETTESESERDLDNP
jgi:hypothetical protein